MKKNFFKKLSFVLAFAMVASTAAPAASASAAATPNLAKRYVNVYEGKTYSYAAKNAKGYTVKWVVSGKGAKYVDLSKKTGTKTVLSVDTEGATAAKNAPVVVTAKFYKGKKLVKSAGDAVTLKVSATAVDIVTKADVTKFPTSEAVKFSRKITPANATSVTYWSVTDKDGKATTKATIDNKGNLTVTELGEYVVVAEAKNAKNGKVIAKDTQEVNAVLGIEKATQQSVTKLDVFFNADMKDAKAADFSIVNDTYKTTIAVKAVSVDGKKVTVETFADINDGKSYTVTYKDVTASFVATDNKVATLAITPATVPATVATEIKVLAKDANGVELSSNSYSEVKDTKITFDITDIKDGYTSGKKLTLNKIGDTAKATATYHTWEYKDGKEVGTITTDLTITAVDKNALTMKETKLHVGDSKPSSWSQSALNDKLALEDSNKKVFVYLKDSNDEVITSGYSLESSNKDAMLLYNNGDLSADVVAVKEGSAYVLVKDVDGKVVLSLPVNVVAKRKAYQLVLGKTSLKLSNSTTVVDKQSISVEVKDQYGDKMPGETKAAENDIEVTCTGTPSGVTKAAGYALADLTQDDKVSFSAPNATAGTYNYTIKAGGYTLPVTVNVQTPTGTSVGYVLVVDNSGVDIKVDRKSTSQDIKLKVAITQNGTIIGYVPFLGTPSVDAAGLGDGIEIKKGNDAVTSSVIATHTNALATNGDYSELTFKALTVTSGGAIKNADIKPSNEVTYSVKVRVPNHKITDAAAHKYAVDGNNFTELTGSFTIKDTQSPLMVKEIKQEASNAGNLNAAIVDLMKFEYEGNEVSFNSNDIVDSDVVVLRNNQYHIKSLKINVTVDDTVIVPLKVIVDKTITVN